MIDIALTFRCRYEILVAILVVIYEVFSAAFVILRAWQAMRIRNDIKFNTNQLERLLLQQGSCKLLWYTSL